MEFLAQETRFDAEGTELADSPANEEVDVRATVNKTTSNNGSRVKSG
jgi:hypothetical protein